MPFEALDQPFRSATGRLAVDIEIVLDQHDGFGARESPRPP
jgi:hypothetical protein